MSPLQRADPRQSGEGLSKRGADRIVNDYAAWPRVMLRRVAVLRAHQGEVTALLPPDAQGVEMFEQVVR